MKRILAIILLLVLLLDGPHPKIDRPATQVAFSVGPKPIWVPVDLAARGYGPLKLFGLWELQANRKDFGGISALIAHDNSGFTAISDNGVAIDFGIGVDAGDAAMTPMPQLPLQPGQKWRSLDSESIAVDPKSGRLWVGYEGTQAICRYAPKFARVEGCAYPAAMAKWRTRRGIESLVRFADGRFLAIEEGKSGAGGRHDVLLWPGDPVDKRTKPPIHLSYEAPSGYAPTDALWLGGDQLLVLNRRLSLFDLGFSAKLVRVRMPKLVANAVLRGAVIADFKRPGPVDNLEALALGRESTGPVLWIASDDNHLFFQRTLLYRMSLPANWISEKPAP